MLEIVLIKEEELKRREDWGNNSVGTLFVCKHGHLTSDPQHTHKSCTQTHGYNLCTVGQGQDNPGDPAGQSV